RPGADHAVGADVGHDHGAVADPAIGADADADEIAALVLDRPVGAAEMVLPPAAQDVHVTADRGVLADDRLAHGAAVADHDARADLHFRVRQGGAEADVAVGRAAV